MMQGSSIHASHRSNTVPMVKTVKGCDRAVMKGRTGWAVETLHWADMFAFLSEQILCNKHNVGGSLGQTTHVPRKPMRTIAYEDAHGLVLFA